LLLKRTIIIQLFFLSQYSSFCQNSFNINLLSRWDNDSLPSNGEQQYNEVIGWYQQSSNKEYAILGGIDSIYFFDITDATFPKLIAAKPGYSKNCINRDFAINSHYLYTVADEGKAALQIYNLSFLPDSVSLIYSNDSLTQNCHTIYEYNNKLFLAKNRIGNQIHPLDILDISNPDKPYLLYSLLAPKYGSGQYMFDMVHDVTAANDTLICFCGNNGLYIYDITNINKPKYLNSLAQYPSQGYCHSGTVYKNHLFFTDENNGKGVKDYNIQNVYNPLYITNISSHPNAIPHNTYIRNTMLWLSSYQDGVTVWSVEDPENPILSGYYDTYLQNNPNEYKGLMGCWALYCNLPSGIILASDMANGLFVLQPTKNLSIPNPTYNQNNLFDIYTLDGKLLYNNIKKNNVLLLDLPTGLYILKNGVYAEKYIITK